MDLLPFEKEAKKTEFSQRFLDLGGHYIHTMTSSVTSFIQKMLNKRINHIQMKPITYSEVLLIIINKKNVTSLWP